MYAIDCEVYRDYFLIMFKDVESGKSAAFDMFPGQDFNATRVRQLLRSKTLVSFNGNSYDIYVISAALQGWDCAKIKALSDEIIKSKLPAWRVAKIMGVKMLTDLDHIDLIEVAPGKASLKIYGGRLNALKMQDLPIEPDAPISPEQRVVLKRYCLNDLDTTEILYRKLEPAIRLREDMGKQYGGIDLRSKSDAQIAEAVIKHELEALTGQTYKPHGMEPGHLCRYVNPKIVSFKLPALKDIFERILAEGFPIGSNGSVQMPEWLQKTEISIGSAFYQMGIGGLHSCEKRQSVVAKSDEMLCDMDVASYYPSIILKLRLSPQSMGDDFLRVYQSIVTRRVRAKRKMQEIEKEIDRLEKELAESSELKKELVSHKTESDGLKLSINGSFGKLGSMYSSLYAPELMIQTTITGQLCLLMLIERLEAVGITVVSANTDGIVVHCNKSRADELEEIAFNWMLDTSFELERSDYRAIHFRDVNNYIAVKTDGKTKRKGVYAEPTLAKNPEFMIVSDAVSAYLSTGASIEKTIDDCRDIAKFVTIRRVEGGGVWMGDYLGKAVRFYYSNSVDRDQHIAYAKNSNKVPKSDGARPLMELPPDFPDDVDIERYIEMGIDMLKDLGVENE